MTQQFWVLKTNVVQCDAGFTVEVVWLNRVRYTEDSRTMLIESEALAPRGAMALYTLTMKWDRPHDGELLDATDRVRIAENIRAAFDFMGWTLDVVNE